MTRLTNRKKTLLVASIALSGVIAGCSSDSDYSFDSSKTAQQKKASVSVAFDPSNGVLPFPNDLLFAGTEDLTLNIPGVADANDYSDPTVALNSLDGFSTIEPIVADFTHAAGEEPVTLIDASTVVLGDTVRVFEVTRLPTGALTEVLGELGAQQVAVQMIPTDVTSDTPLNGSTLAIVPIVPLKESSTYMIVITNGVQDEQGRAVTRGGVYGLAAGSDPLEDPLAAQLQAAVQNTLALASSQGIDPNTVVMSWSVTTQSITPVLQQLANTTEASAPQLVATGQDSPGGAADIYAGVINVPYYLDVPTEENPVAPLNTFFTNASGSFLTPVDSVPVVKSTQTIPVLMSKPKGTPASGRWPIAIFQHGITRNRGDMLAVADSMALAGYAVIAIDFPMHGILEGDPLLGALRQAGSERLFDVDFVNNDTSATGPDGQPDASGTHFYNLRNLLNTRANIRQAVSDLLTLSASVGTLDDIDADRKAFIGHSLGAIVGTTFVANDPSIVTASMVAGGGGLSRLLAASPAFGEAIKNGLASAGVDIDSAQGNQFLNAAQTVVDSVDPSNHAAAAAGNALVHVVQINNDRVVINNLQGFPSVGTEALARNMGLLQPTSADTAGSVFVKFNTGAHGSLLTPADTDDSDEGTPLDISDEDLAAVFAELQGQISNFAATQALKIGNPAVIATE